MVSGPACLQLGGWGKRRSVVVNVPEIDPAQFKGTPPHSLLKLSPGNEQLTRIAGRTNAHSAVNGGYFVIGATDGTPGDLAGISILWQPREQAVVGQSHPPLTTARGARVAALMSQQTATANRWCNS